MIGESPENPPKSIETLKEEARKILADILDTRLTVEEIEEFADIALNKTIDLIAYLVGEYDTNQNFEGDEKLSRQQKENRVCEKLGIDNIDDILQSILVVGDRIRRLKKSVGDRQEKSGLVITPPDSGEVVMAKGAGVASEPEEFKQNKLVPRLLTLAYIIETDFGINIEESVDSVNFIKGEVPENALRKTPYVRVIVPSLNRVVYVCDEENNVSYVFDSKKLEEHGIKIEDLDLKTKKEKNALIQQYPGVGVRIKQHLHWRDMISFCLGSDLPAQRPEKEIVRVPKSRAVRPEFQKSKYEWLHWEKFVEDVRHEWRKIPDPKPSSIPRWYNKIERKNHVDTWPSNPDKHYIGLGWVSWFELIDRQWLELDKLQQEAREIWKDLPDPKPYRKEKWYSRERKNHLYTWPPNPKEHYGDKWVGFNDFVGEKNPHEHRLLFPEFKTEVCQVWKAIPIKERLERIDVWFSTERMKPEYVDTWPPNPRSYYRKYGWVSWAELVDRKWLDFDVLQREVQETWDSLPDPKPTNKALWYKEERGNHPDTWRSDPDKYYIGKGWEDWFVFVGSKQF